MSAVDAKAKARASNKTKRRVLRDNIRGITSGSIERLMHQAGVKTFSGLVHDEVRGILKLELENAIRDIITLTKSDRRKTVMPEDVLDYFESLTKTAGVYPTGFEDQLSRCNTYEQVRAKRQASEKKRSKSKKGDSEKQKTSRRKPRHPQALRKIRFYQKQHDCVIFPKLAFYRLVQEYTQDFTLDMRWSADAMGLLQIAMEAHLRDLFVYAQLSAIHGKRQRVMPKDLRLTRRIYNDID